MGRVIYPLIFFLTLACNVAAVEARSELILLSENSFSNKSFRSARERADTTTQQKDSTTDSEFRSARETQQLDLDTSSVTKNSSQKIKIESYTVYESNFLPGFRPCTPEDYRKQDSDPIACQDDDVARMLSTRSEDGQKSDLVVKDNVAPDGNIYKLRFQRFKRKKE